MVLYKIEIFYAFFLQKYARIFWIGLKKFLSLQPLSSIFERFPYTFFLRQTRQSSSCATASIFSVGV